MFNLYTGALTSLTDSLITDYAVAHGELNGLQLIVIGAMTLLIMFGFYLMRNKEKS